MIDNTVPQDGAVAAYWAEFCRAASVPESTPYQAWYFGDTPALAHELAELVLHGPKRATASLAWSNEAAPQAAPVPDGYSVITEFDGTPRAVIRTTSLETRALSAVDAQFAWDEGEGDRTLADWLDGHRRYFARECAQLGRTFSDDAPVALERFELLYPFDRALAAPDGPRIVPGMTVTLETLLATLLTEVRTRRAATLSLDDLATHVERARRYGRDRLAHRGP